jgi:flagellar motor switch protein FliM
MTMDQSMFTKAEMELLLKSALAGKLGGAGIGDSPAAEPFDFQGVNRLSSAQIAKLLELHSGFAEKLGRSLSAQIGGECKAVAESIEQMAYGELQNQFSESALFATVHNPSLEASVLLQADLASVLPIIDLTIGGPGMPAETIRPLTDMEREIFSPVLDAIGDDLRAAWAPYFQATLHFQPCGGADTVLPAAERVLTVKLKIEIGELQGNWNLILPMLVSNALTMKLEQQSSRTEPERSEQTQTRIRERLLDSRFKLELFLPPSGLSVRKLAHLKPGQVVVLKPRATDPIHFNIAGIHLFQASPVSCGTRRGAQIKRTLSIVKEEKEAR